MSQERLTLTVEEAAALLGVSRALAYDMVKVGKIPAIRFGKRLVIPRAALERLLQGRDGTDSEPGVS